MYPPLGFNFCIKFKGLDDPNMVDSHFQSISGLEAIIERALVNQDDNILASTLILKRAARNLQSSPLNRWLFSHFNKTKNIAELPEAIIELLDETNSPYMAWTIKSISPKSWKLSELNAEKSEVLIETIELSYKAILFSQIA